MAANFSLSRQNNRNWKYDFTNKMVGAINAGTLQTEIVSIKASAVQEAIKVSGSDSLRMTEALNYTMDQGFSEVSDYLSNIDSSIDKLSKITWEGFSMLKDYLRISNQYLGRIEDILRIADKQKERIYFIEEGLKYYTIGLIEGLNSNEQYFSLAMESFNKSLAIEKNDFFSLFYVGRIYLISENPDFAKAEACFKSAAFFGSIEARVGGTSFSRSINKSAINFSDFTSNAYLNAAEACFEQEKYLDAAELAEKAWQAYSENIGAGLMQAVYLVHSGKVRDAIPVLEKAITQNREIFRTIEAHELLSTTKEVTAYLDSRILEVQQKIKQWLSNCYQEIGTTKDTTSLKSFIENVEECSRSRDFLILSETFDKLYENKNWSVKDGAIINHDGKVLSSVGSSDFHGTAIDFMIFEKRSVQAKPVALNLIRIQELEKRKRNVGEGSPNLYQEINHYTTSFQRYIIIGIIVTAIPFVFYLNSNEPGQVAWYVTLILAILSAAYFGYMIYFEYNELTKRENELFEIKSNVNRIQKEITMLTIENSEYDL